RRARAVGAHHGAESAAQAARRRSLACAAFGDARHSPALVLGQSAMPRRGATGPLTSGAERLADMQKTIVVVPCYNEAARLPAESFLEAAGMDLVIVRRASGRRGGHRVSAAWLARRGGFQARAPGVAARGGGSS